MASISVLQYEGNNKTFVWKHPNQNFTFGSQLIVRESQEAVFMLNGEVLDTYGAGRHTLETERLKVSDSAFRKVLGRGTAFKAELYFVNKTEQMAIRWGTDSKIQYLEPIYGFPVELGACGEMSLTAINAPKLLVKLVGTEKVLTQETLTAYFRSILLVRVKTLLSGAITEQKINIFELDQHLSELSDLVKEKLKNDFYDYGVDLSQFMITTIVKPVESRHYQKFLELYYRQVNDVTEAELQQKLTLIEQSTKAQQTILEAQAEAQKRQLGGYTYQQEKGFEVAKAVAENDAVAQMGNVGIGLGMMSGIGGTLGQAVGNATGQTLAGTFATENVPANFVKCPKCGKELAGNALFCSWCGAKLKQQETCPDCGHVYADSERFCPVCGRKRG